MSDISFPLYLSLKVSILATVIAFVIGVLLAALFAFRKNGWTRLLSLITTLPLILPPTVLGYYILVTLGRNSWLGQTYEQIVGQPLVFTWQAAVIAASIAALPLLVRPIQASFESIDEEVIEAAKIDGAARRELFVHVILPLSYKGIIGGIVMGFARAMGEFGATLMVAGNIPGRTQTLSIAIYDAVQANRMEDAHLMVLILSIITISILLVFEFVLRKK
ncbi:molybdate ABC transporter permease subunit [Salsuginibacillus kocurii]|uniref:molybdate ABC transporter permease subunit n=1 Tax=Salsuginibacillus kocurii TaxID=427078 RepID=UPI0003614CD3|nr:molybdate ABC transporter permease subunit [Salsuginibacillus kocurii]